MPTLKMLLLVASLLSLCVASAARAGSVYRWTSGDGSIAYSDDLKKIPSQYRASAKRIHTGRLEGYARYTPAQTRAASHEKSLALRERIDRARDVNETSQDRAEPRGTTNSILRLDNRTSVTVPHDRNDSGEPIVVEE